ncbi:MAG: aminopeptidase P family protein [Chloroflexota bacterium]
MSQRIANRLQKLRHLLAEKEIDAILISQPENRYYLSGFWGSAGFLLISQKDAILATDFRYVEQAKIQAPDFSIFRITGEVGEWFPKLIAGLTLGKLGFEAGHITFELYRKLTSALSEKQSPLKLISQEELVESLRTIKEAEEIELIARAAAIGDKTFEHIKSVIRPGMTEKQAAWEIEKFLREHDSQSMSFDIIVAAGANAALPHHHPSDQPIREGESIVIDFGARVAGYTSDLTRTICLGSPDDKFRKVYDIVLGAQLAAIAIIKEGMTGKEADSLARTVIKEAGYDEYFGHGLGHGVGLQTHEAPRLSYLSSDVLKSNMVFSIEPGIYLPGWGGVRIEDLVVLEESKVRVISQARKVAK